MAAEDLSTRAIARDLGTMPRTVSHWRIRWTSTGGSPRARATIPISSPRPRRSSASILIRPRALSCSRSTRSRTSQAGDSDRRSLSWSIDQSGSAAEWRRASGADTEIPPYGLWRRVDDAMFDALACWPPGEQTGPQPSRINSWGGWLNGAWSARLRRVGAGHVEPNKAIERGPRAVPRAARERAAVVALRRCEECGRRRERLPACARSGPGCTSCRGTLRSPSSRPTFHICGAATGRR